MEENDIKISIVRSDEDYEDMKNVRRQVFVKEYNIPESLEFDGNDHSSTHVIARRGSQPIGTMRIRYFADFVKFERMAVIPEYRDMAKVNVADLIMNKAMKFVSYKGYRKVYGLCKQELLTRWQKCGYHPIEDAPSVQQNNMTLVPIMRDLPKNPEAINFNKHPALLNAVEDCWDDVACQIEKTYIKNKQPTLALLMRLKTRLSKTINA